jgi:hypothetical protein
MKVQYDKDEKRRWREQLNKQLRRLKNLYSKVRHPEVNKTNTDL